MAIKRLKLMADFETTTDPGDVRVWAGCAVDIEKLEVAFLGTSIDAFMEYLSDKQTVCYFHNIRFDGEFILHWLLTHGYKFNPGTKDGRRVGLKSKEFTCLITDDGLFYSLEVVFEKIDAKKFKKVVFYDSLKKLPFPVAKIAKAFELQMAKGSIDYDADRPVGYELTQEEKEYIITDCQIVAEALKIQFSQDLTRMTNASDAMASYKRTVGGNFDRWFPIFPYEMDKDLRRSYKGGYVYLNPKYKGARGLIGKQYDINSLYPWSMFTCVLPYSYPVFFEGKPTKDDRYPLFIIHMKCTFELKPDHLPTLQLKNTRRFVETEYLTSSRVQIGGHWENEPVEMWLTSVDYQLLLDHYEIDDVTYINGYKFKGAVGMFKDYIDYWMHIKETTTGALRSLAKLMLNSLYGRFSLATRTKRKYPYLDESGTVRYEYSDWEYRDPVYVPMGAFITSYCRERTIRSAQANYDRFIYSDTDSLKLLGHETPDNLEIHPTHLGAWKDEGDFVDSAWIRAKTYLVSIPGEKDASLRSFARLLNDPFVYGVVRWGRVIRYRTRKVTCAGMPDNVKEQVTYDNFRSGSTFDGKLMPRRYPGGIVLEPTTFTIK